MNDNDTFGMPSEFIKPRKVAVAATQPAAVVPKHPLDTTFEQYNDATFELHQAQERVKHLKRQLVEYAVKNEMFEAISVNIYRLRRMTAGK